ncbi:MAG: hypothetical protein WBO42_08120 [Candidatus Nanopelagicales bacterium]
MKITPERLGQAAGLCAAAAGAIFVLVQINHPAMNLDTVTTSEWVVRSTAKLLMTALALVGITGIYLRQFRQVGVMGLIGYLLFSLGYLAMLGVEVVAAFVLPALTESDPGFVSDILRAAAGGSTVGDIGLMQVVLSISGIAIFRAGVQAKWAAALLAAGTISTLALSVLPEAFNRFFALPVGVALVGLGLSLWNDQRRRGAEAEATVANLEPAPTR